MNGSGGWVPIRVGLNDVNAYYDGTQVQIGHTQTGGKWIGSHGRRRARVRPRRRRPHPGRHLRRRHPGVRRRHLRRGRPSGSPTTRPTPRTTSSARRSTWSARARSATCTTRPRSATPTATRARSRAPRCTPPPARATTGSTCWPRAPTRPTASRPARPATARRVTGVGIQNAQQDHVQRDADEDVVVVVPEVPHLDAHRGEEPRRAAATSYNKVKAAWNAVSVPAQAADPTCGSTGTVTVTNPGNKSGTVGSADRVLHAVRLGRHRAVHLVGHRSSRRA